MSSERDNGIQMVEDFKSAHPDAYARWFLLEAMGLGITEISDELNAFIRSRFGPCEPMVSGGMAMRDVIAPEARRFIEQLAPKLEDWQRRDVQRHMNAVTKSN